MSKLYNYYDPGECNLLKRYLRSFSYVSPMYEKLLIQYSNNLLLEVVSTVQESRFNRQINCFNDLSDLNYVLKQIINYVEDQQEKISTQKRKKPLIIKKGYNDNLSKVSLNNYKFIIYLFDIELFILESS